MPKIAASILIEENVCWLGKKFGFMADIRLEVPCKDKWVTYRIATRVAIYEEFLNAGLKIPLLPAMVDLL